MKTYKIKSWKCPDCGYSQDFSPTKELMAIHFPGLPEGKCPACIQGKTKTREKKSVDLIEAEEKDKVQINILEDADIDVMKDEKGIDLTIEEKNALKAEVKEKEKWIKTLL